MENNTPYFSIITPAYNRADFLTQTTQSILSQTFTNWEYILIDDASTDNTEDIMKGFNDPRVVYLKNETNKERGYSRNRGIDIARGKYICFLDSDDEFCNNHLQYLYDSIQKSKEKTALFFTKSYQQFGDGPLEKRQFMNLADYNTFEYILKHTFNHNCVAVHKEVFKHNRYDETIPGLEDLDLWLHIAMDYPLVQLDEYTNTLRFHDGSYTLGGFKRYNSELTKFKYIFAKPEFKHILPNAAKHYLISKTYYFLAICYEEENRRSKMYSAILKAYWLYPKGYNVNSNKTMLVMFVYHIPLIGSLFKSIIRALK